MHWLFAARRLRRLGILGMNRRNAACILDHNPRAAYPVVDDKLRMARLCAEIGVATPAVYAVADRHSQLRRLDQLLAGRGDFVVKPARGSAGRGVLVLVGRDGPDFLRHNGARLPADGLRQHVSDILSGMYSLGGRPDAAVLQQRVRLHPAFAPVAFQGIPDVRVILYRGEPAMAMLRLPTKESGGRANLHQGGIGAGVDLAAGVTNHAVQRNRFVRTHPDTGAALVGVAVPAWADVLGMARRAAAAVGLGYLGVDIVIDATDGPMLLEANARPGLAIQIANGCGLLPRLAAIDGQLARPPAPAAERQAA
ncbi:MAG TPA: alpha-L-glutamate ligase-like protein [Gemmataceae bacterium]|jgi:alpha-L-glutamate ligase-like protein